MPKWIEFLAKARGWWRAGLVMFAGMVAALAMPPLDFWPLLFVTVPVALFALERIERRFKLQSFLLGWCFGFGYFIVAFHWIGFAFFVDQEDYLWMMPFAVGGLAAAMAVYWGLAFFCVTLSGLKRFSAALIFAASLALFEYLRGILFTGFPWAALGLASDGMGAVAQTASIWGMPGLTVLILLWSPVWPFVFDRHSPRRHRLAALMIVATLPLCWAWGSYRLQHGNVANVENMNIRIVQPNIPQSDKWRSENDGAIFEQLLEMSARAPKDGKPVTHIIWPETAVPFLIDESESAKAAVAQLLGGSKTLVTGALRRELSITGEGESDNIYNSILTFDGFGNVVAQYDKWRLVPGGEFLPFEWLLEPLGFRRVVTVPGSFAAGGGPLSLAIPGAPSAGFSICYEAIFPDHFVDPLKRPSWLINVRMRASEQGLPLVRAANTGISAVIDPFGRILSSLPLGQEGVLESGLPQSLPPTFFATYGQLLFFFALLLLCALGIVL
jgi:apolipoprotein N-acyltransferase